MGGLVALAGAPRARGGDLPPALQRGGQSRRGHDGDVLTTSVCCCHGRRAWRLPYSPLHVRAHMAMHSHRGGRGDDAGGH